MSIISIENLSNELFYQIFDYLDGIDVYRAFSNLNHRFQQLLNLSHLRYKLHFYPKSNDFDLCISMYKKFMIAHRHQIYAFFLDNLSNNEQFIQLFWTDSSLNQLESLVLNQLQPNLLIKLISDLSFLPHLLFLTITIWEGVDLNHIYQFVFDLPMLKYYKPDLKPDRPGPVELLKQA
jgi:hypothetical protein